MRAAPNVFTIPPGPDFARTLVEALASGRLFPLPPAGDPFRFADIQIYVPTRRSIRQVQDAFLAINAGIPLILPDIRPLGEPGDPLEEAGEAEEGEERAAAGPRQVSPIERSFRLLPAILDWQAAIRARHASALGEEPSTPSLAQSLALADRLGRLIDEMAIEGRPLADLATIAPDEFDPSRFDDYWSMTREFLTLAARHWPETLEAIGGEDKTARRLRLLGEEATRLAQDPAPRPMIIAGSTGSVRATAELMRVVSRLDRGAVVLPGLDSGLDANEAEGAWSLIGRETSSLPTRFGHPQAALKRSLEIIGIDRTDVVVLGKAAPEHFARERFLSESFRPAETSGRWIGTRASVDIAQALQGVTLVEAVDEREEARSIALLMRQTLEQPDARVALVTADRGLAQRVSCELAAFGIEVEDSAGSTLGETPAGLALRLAGAAMRLGDSAAMLAFLRHPLSPVKREDIDVRAIEALDLFICRQHRFDAATPWAERHRLAREGASRLSWPWGEPASEQDWDLVAGLCRRIDDWFAPLHPAADAQTLQNMLEALLGLVAPGEPEDSEPPELDRIRDVFAEFAAEAGTLKVATSDLPALVEKVLASVSVPAGEDGRSRAQILGYLEARLMNADRVILGAFNEGSVPPAVPGDPFLNRAMRLALGLQPGERRIGQSAHDVTMLMGLPDVILTRAARVGTSPGIPSRFLRRMEAFAGLAFWKETVLARGNDLLRQVRAAEKTGPRQSIARTAVTPAEPRLPASMSITDFRLLMRDPYALYAKRILRLSPVGNLDPAPDASDRGTLLHRILERYARATPPADHADALQFLRDIATEEFRPLARETEAQRFWWQAFERLAEDFVAFDREARLAGRTVLTEVPARYGLVTPAGFEMRVTGVADRIEIGPNGCIRIIDYKSGGIPKDSDIRKGVEPQLTISAALSKRGAFRDVPSEAAVELVGYLPIGGSNPAQFDPYKGDDQADVIEKTWREALIRLELLAEGAEPYLSEREMPQGSFSDYRHLARVAEWSRHDEPEEDQ